MTTPGVDVVAVAGGVDVAVEVRAGLGGSRMIRVVATTADPNTDALAPVVLAGFRDVIFDTTTRNFWANENNMTTGWRIIG